MGRNGIWREQPTRAEVARCAASLVPECWRSRGGRQCFLHEGNHLLVEDDPAAVAEAVRHLAGGCADGAAIRERAIAVMREDRARLIAAVDELVAERGGGTPLSERWDQVFTNRLLTWQCLDDVAARLHAAAGDGTPSPS